MEMPDPLTISVMLDEINSLRARIEYKDAEIAKLKWQVSGEMENCAKLRALLRDTLAVAEAFKGRSDKDPILRRAREALDEQLATEAKP